MSTINLNLNSSLANTIQGASSLISSVVNGLIVSPNGAPPGVSGFVFNIIDVEEIFVDSEITDNFVEENYATQDHIALKPISFTLKGFQGELVAIAGVAFNPILTSILALAPLTQVNPSFNVQDGQIYSAIALQGSQAENVINQVPSLFSLIGNLANVQTMQQSAFNFFLNMRNNRQLVTIQTPYGLLTNYFVENFRARQPGDSRFMSDFTVTFKQIQVVSTATTPTAATPNPAGSGAQATNSDSQITPSAPPAATLPSQSNTNNSPISTDNSSGRLTDMTSPPILAGQTAGVTALPDTNPVIPVNVPNVFPTSNPIFNTLPLLNTATPGFIPAV